MELLIKNSRIILVMQWCFNIQSWDIKLYYKLHTIRKTKDICPLNIKHPYFFIELTFLSEWSLFSETSMIIKNVESKKKKFPVNPDYNILELYKVHSIKVALEMSNRLRLRILSD